MIKYALVKFNGSSTKYLYFTQEHNLTKDQEILVDTVNGIKVAKFHCYNNDSREFYRANKWILMVLDADRIKRNLEIELEEEGILMSDPFGKKERYNSSTKRIEKARDEDAIKRIMKKHAKEAWHGYFWDDDHKIRF